MIDEMLENDYVSQALDSALGAMESRDIEGAVRILVGAVAVYDQRREEQARVLQETKVPRPRVRVAGIGRDRKEGQPKTREA